MRAPVFIKRLSNSFIPLIIVAFFVILSMTLLSHATENASKFGRLHLALVVVNIIGMLVLIGLIGANMMRLIRQLRRRSIGSKLTSKMVLIFVILSVVPVTVVYYFSIGFLQRGIDSWFDVEMEKAMNDSLELSRISLELNMREILHRSRALAADLSNVSDSSAHLILDDMRIESDALELSLLSDMGVLIAASVGDTLTIIPHRPDDVILQEARDHQSYTGLRRGINKSLQIQVAVSVANANVTSSKRILFALFRVPERIGELANNVELTYGLYKKQVFLQDPLKGTFVLTLSLVLMLSLLTAVWVAFFSAQRLVSPIRVLAAGTRAVAAGDYDKRLPEVSNDELGELVESFTNMTRQLAIARDQAEHDQDQIEQQRAYLGAVLARLSSGVITLNVDLRVRVANNAASQLLDLDFSKSMGQPIGKILKSQPHLSSFIQQIRLHIDKNDSEWREEIQVIRNSNTKILICQGAKLNAELAENAGFVLVFDDVTMIMKSQRAAAWGDVARRLAHEVKNPLTPIQLSAERLKRKLKPKLTGQDADMLERMTNTIVQQVQTMKHLVKAFAEYARAPKIELRPLYVDKIVNEVLDLYGGVEAEVKFETFFSDDHPQVSADPDRMRQLLNNLIKNAMESTKDVDSPIIAISVSKLALPVTTMMELRVSDNGHGIPDNLLNSLFEPYATSKSKGGGLGLTVVNRIVEEHSGSIYVENHSARLNSESGNKGETSGSVAVDGLEKSELSRFDTGATFVVQIPAIDKGKDSDIDLYVQTT